MSLSCLKPVIPSGYPSEKKKKCLIFSAFPDALTAWSIWSAPYFSICSPSFSPPPLSPFLPRSLLPVSSPPDPMNNTVFAFASRLSNKLTLPHQMPCFPHPPHFTLLTSTHFFNSHCRSYILTRYTERSESPIRQDHGMLCFTYGLSYINIYCFIYIY